MGVFAESRYDALGRQVRTRARADPLTCTSTWRCLETGTVTVWDGAQTLAEVQTRGTEQVAVQLVHAGGVDVPLAIQRAGGRVETLVPSRDWQGEAYGGWWRATGSWIVHAPGDPAAPTPVDWRSNGLTLDGAQAVPAATGTWWGSVLGGRAEATGAVYLRARHYDPATGRFLQPDPTGLDGGANRYGYAGGDAVNFADPFGLCAPVCITIALRAAPYLVAGAKLLVESLDPTPDARSALRAGGTKVLQSIRSAKGSYELVFESGMRDFGKGGGIDRARASARRLFLDTEDKVKALNFRTAANVAEVLGGRRWQLQQSELTW